MALDGSGATDGSIGGTIFGILDRVASFELIKSNGLPYILDGGRPVPVVTAAPQQTEQTPPAPPGGSSALNKETMGISNKTLLIGGGVALGLLALIAVTR